MFDTTRFRLNARLRPGATLTSLRPAIRLSGDQHLGILKDFECSLPRVLFGNNGQLISNQTELDVGLREVQAKLETVAVLPPIDEWVPRRLDLVWQFGDLPASRVINALSAFRYPSVQKPPLHQIDHGVIWRGSGSRFIVTAYNKSKQMRVPGDVLRIEFRLSANGLRHLKGGNWRNFGEMWSVYRELIGKMPDIPKFEDQMGLPEAIGRFVPPEYHESILSGTKGCQRTKRSIRRKIRISAASLPAKLCWHQFLPPIPSPITPVVCPRRFVRNGH